MKYARLMMCAVLALAIVSLVGCGGSDPAAGPITPIITTPLPTATNPLQVSVQWPERAAAKTIPVTAEYIYLYFAVDAEWGEQYVSYAHIARPATSACLYAPSGAGRVKAEAYDGDWEKVAAGETDVVVQAGANDPVNLVLQPLGPAPRNLAVESLSDTTARVSWSPPTGYTAAVQRYELQLSTNGEPFVAVPQNIGPDVTEVTLDLPIANCYYQVRLRAVFMDGVNSDYLLSGWWYQ